MNSKKCFLIFGISACLYSGIIEKADAEPVCNCGKVKPTDCCWEVVGDTLKISGTGDMQNYTYNKSGITNAPWGEFSSSIESVDIQGVISTGDRAFRGLRIKNVQFGDTVQSIGVSSFAFTALQGELSLPPSLKNIGKQAFEWSGQSTLTSIIIPDSVEKIEQSAFRGTHGKTFMIIPYTVEIEEDGLGEIGFTVICKGSAKECENLDTQLENYMALSTRDNTTLFSKNLLTERAYVAEEDCDGSFIYEQGACHKRTESQCNETDDYYYNGYACVYRPSNGKIKCYGANHVENHGRCNRIRYTPAEASAIAATDHNTQVLYYR